MCFSKTTPLPFLVLASVVSIAIAANPEGASLRVSASLHKSVVVDRCPLIVTMSVVNNSRSPVRERFSPRTTDYLLSNARLLVTGPDRRVYQLSWDGGQPDEGMYAPVYTLDPKKPVRVDWILPAVISTRDKHRGIQYEFLPTGDYTGRVRLPVQGGTIESNEFTFTIEKPRDCDVEARDSITVVHAAFFQGKGSAQSYADYLNGKAPRRGASHARYEELERILKTHPDSPYAGWIRFWKLYHHGSVDDAVEWCRGHRDFPLADNLMLHKAETLFNSAGKHDRRTYSRVRKLVDDLLRDFPDGDTRARAIELQQKLTRKP